MAFHLRFKTEWSMPFAPKSEKLTENDLHCFQLMQSYLWTRNRDVLENTELEALNPMDHAILATGMHPPSFSISNLTTQFFPKIDLCPLLSNL